MKLIQILTAESVEEGGTFSPWFALAYYDYYTARFIGFVYPLNLLIGWWHEHFVFNKNYKVALSKYLLNKIKELQKLENCISQERRHKKDEWFQLGYLEGQRKTTQQLAEKVLKLLDNR